MPPTADAAPVRMFRALHDVDGSAPDDGDVFKFEASTGIMRRIPRNGANGYAGTDADGLIPVVNIPPDWRVQMLASVSTAFVDFYARLVLAKLPSDYRRMGAAVGAAVEPDVGANHNPAGAYSGGVTLGEAGAVVGSTNTAARFGGVSGKLNLGHPQAFDITTKGVINVWYKLNSVPAANVDYFLVTKDGPTGRSWSFYVENDIIGGRGLTLGAQLNGGGAVYPTGLVLTVDGQWHMATLRFDTNVVSFLHDGIPYGTAAGTPNVTTQDVLLGARGFVGSEGWLDGWLDECTVWNGTVLTDAQIAGLYAAGVAGNMIEPPAARFPTDGSGPGAVTAAFRGINAGRVDFLLVGDSEPLLGGYGYDSGLSKALGVRGAQFAGPLFTTRENDGSGAATGYLMSAGEAGVGTAGVGALAPHAAFLDRTFYPDGYLNSDVPAGSTGGLIVDSTSLIRITDSILYEVHYGTFANGTHTLRLAGQPLAFMYDTGDINCTTGRIGFARRDVLLPANAGRAGSQLNFQFNRIGVAGSTAVFAAYERVSNPGRPVGWSVTPLDCKGGQKTRVIAGDFYAVDDFTLAYKLSQFRRLQGENGRTVVLLMGGQNDEDDVALSIGPNPQASNTAGGRTDNIDAIIFRLRYVWQYVCGWPACDLLFLVVVSHPLDDPGVGREVWLETCRIAADAQALKQPFFKHVNLADYTNHDAMVANSWYNGADEAHLSTTGYDVFGDYIVQGASDPALDAAVSL